MPKLSKQEFARLAADMAGAPPEEIIAEAKRREAEPEQGMLGKAWELARTPLTDAPSRVAQPIADAIDQRSLDESKLGAQLKGFAAGAIQGAGDLATSFTAPLDLALNLVGAGGHVAGAKGLLGISKAARVAEAGLQAPLAAEGAYNAVEGVSEGNYGKAGMGAMQAVLSGAGMKTAGQHSFPPAKVRDAYMQSKGREVVPTPRVEKLDPEFAKRTADAYQAMPHAPENPQVAAAYRAMSDETSDQFQFLRDRAGVKMEPWTAEGQPYANSAEMMADITNNNRLFYFPSDAGFGATAAASGNPLLKQGKSGAPVNDEFRAAHDYFGHAVEGNQFGPLGEERAYQAHRQMFPAEAVPALTTETRGQNSWVNFGEHLRRPDGSLPKKGEEGFVPPGARPFAEQKTGLLPEEFQSAVPAATSPSSALRGTGTSEPSASRPAYALDEASVKVDELTRKNGGASFNLHKGDLVGSDHYAVSVFPDRGVVVDGEASPEVIRKFIGDNEDLLQDPNNTIGTWFNKDDGKTYLDISTTVPSLDDALRIGREKNQLAIFDLKNLEEIKVPESGVTGAAPAATRLAGDVPAEFHAVEPQTAPPAAGLKVVEDGPIAIPQGKSKVAEQKAKLDAFRADAAASRASTALGVAGLTAQTAIGNDNLFDFGDEDTNNGVRAAVGMMGVLGLGSKAFAKVPKPKGVFHTPGKGFQAVHPVTRRAIKIGLAESADNARVPLVTQGIDPKWEAEFAKVGLKNGTPPPAKSFDQLVQLKNGKLRFTKEVEARLRTLYRYGQEKFSAEGGAEWLENGILDDMLKFLPVEKPATASHRLFGALSPATDVSGNLMDMIRVSLRAKKNFERGALQLDDPKAVAKDLMQGVGNKPSKAPNVARALRGEPLQSYAKPDPLPAGKVDDLARGMAGELDAIPFDMWWARALGLPNDAQPSNGYAYKLLFEAGEAIAKKNGEEAFPFMAKVWAAMKQLHGGGGGVAPNKLAGDIGLGQKDLFDGSTIPSGQAGKDLLKKVQQGSSELLGGLGVNSRADATLKQADEARHLLGVAEETGFKGLRTGRFNKMENSIKKAAYKKFVTDRAEGVSFKQGQEDAGRWIGEQLSKLRDRMETSKSALKEHVTQKLGESELPLDVDNDLLLRRVEEILSPGKVQKARYKAAMKGSRAADIEDDGLPSMATMTRFLKR